MSTSFRTSKGLVLEPAEAVQDRMFIEQQKLRIYFPQWKLIGKAGYVRAAVGSLQPRKGGSQYPMKITVPPHYPYEMPDILVDGWTPRAGTPHRYGETSLCVLKPKQWSSTLTIAFLVAKTAIWLAKYEVWCSTSRWPGNEQGHGFGDLLRDLLS